MIIEEVNNSEIARLDDELVYIVSECYYIDGVPVVDVIKKYRSEEGEEEGTAIVKIEELVPVGLVE